MKERGSVLVAFALVFLFVLSVGVVSAFWSFSATGKVTDDYSTSAQIIIPEVQTYDGLSAHGVVSASRIQTSKKAVSVGGWFRTEAFRTGNNEITGSWVSKRNSFILSAETDGSVKFWVFLDDAWYSVSSGANRLPLNTWDHWVGTWDGATLSLYRGGVIEASASASGALGTTGDLYIGHDNLPAPYDNRYFEGKLYDVRVYADALSEQAVKDLYREGKKKLAEMTTTQCTDSDKNATYPDGKNYFVKGILTNKDGGKATDYCGFSDEGAVVFEYYCASADASASEKYACANGCSDGACVTSGGEQTAMCTDSDKNAQFPDGKNYFVKGILTNKDGGKATDYCGFSDEGAVVFEYYCASADASASEKYACANGCSDGACVTSGGEQTAMCTDSDKNAQFPDGKNYNVKGTITGKTFHVEIVAGETDVTIHSATEVTIVYDPPGKQPQTFRIKLGEKFNVDGNIGTLKSIDVINQRVTLEYDTLADTCNGDKELIERVCDELGDYSVEYVCPNGCVDRACVTGGGDGSSDKSFTFDYSGGDRQFTVINGSERFDVRFISIRSEDYYNVTDVEVKENGNWVLKYSGVKDGDSIRVGSTVFLIHSVYFSSSPYVKQVVVIGRGGVTFVYSASGGSGSTGTTTGSSNSCATIGCSLLNSDGSNKCIGFGTRTGGNYCALSGTMKAQGAAEAICENNYECGSNVCASGKCLDAGLFQKIIDFFRKLFGG